MSYSGSRPCVILRLAAGAGLGKGALHVGRGPRPGRAARCRPPIDARRTRASPTLPASVIATGCRVPTSLRAELAPSPDPLGDEPRGAWPGRRGPTVREGGRRRAAVPYQLVPNLTDQRAMVARNANLRGLP